MQRDARVVSDMTNLVTAKPAGKRERLVGAARELIHRQGVERTTIADIAKEADVPLGNVYYYFKAKDDLVRAVIEAHSESILKTLRGFDDLPTPRDRLIAFAREFVTSAPEVAQHGCPHGSFCSELAKRADEQAEAGAVLMRLRVDWAREQFKLMGRDDADQLAFTLISIVQGASLLANTYHDPSVLTDQVQRTEQWLNDLS